MIVAPLVERFHADRRFRKLYTLELAKGFEPLTL